MYIVGLILAISGAIGFIGTLILTKVFLRKNKSTEDEIIDAENELYPVLRKYWAFKIAFGIDVIIGAVIMYLYK